MKLSALFIISFAAFSSILYAKALRVRRNALKDEKMHWPNAIVVYNIDSAFYFYEVWVILQAMKNIESVSCVRFKRHSGEKGYVDIVKESKCTAVIGYSGTRQKITLGNGCVVPSVVLHELFHTLGFEHEHTRPDRDQYVTINKDNIKPEDLYNFAKKSSKEFTYFGLPYDFKSIMHYGDNFFAIRDSQKAIQPILGPPGIGRASVMSLLDVMKLNRLYRCQISQYQLLIKWYNKFYKSSNVIQ